MADKDFQIKEELVLHLGNLGVLLGGRTKRQMTSSEVKETKDVDDL